MRKDHRSSLEVEVSSDSRRSGKTVVSLSFLSSLPAEHASRVVEGVRRFSRRFSAASPTYRLRLVLSAWHEMCIEHRYPHFSSHISVPEAQSQLAELRVAFFVRQTERRRSLLTTANTWTQFRAGLLDLMSAGAIPTFTTTASFLAPPSTASTHVKRRDATSSCNPLTLPATINFAADSYNDGLLEPLSITSADDTYLNEYERRLATSLAAIKAAACNDLKELENLRDDGRRLIELSPFASLEGRDGPRSKYWAPGTRTNILDPKKNHPDLLAGILWIVATEMDGIPKLHRKYSGSDPRRKRLPVGGAHWRHVGGFGKNKLLPYLGVMSTEAAVCCMVILMIEHPRLNATSLYRAKLWDSNGNSRLVSSSGVGDALGEELTLTLDKPRAGEQKSVVLSPLARRVVGRIIEWTAPLREELIRLGRQDDARYLWLAMSHLNYKIFPMSEKAFVNTLRPGKKSRCLGERPNQNRVTPFTDRHPELARWSERITFKSLRSNAIVLLYLQSGGDLVASAYAAGHKNIRTTIENYIPRTLSNAIHERQIRRHQNLLIARSSSSELEMLNLTDFEDLESLHEFLLSIADLPRLDSEDSGCASQENEKHDNAIRRQQGKVFLNNDRRALAVALLYRDSLSGASDSVLDAKDKRTGFTPRFWIQFVDAVSGPLPPAYAAIQNVVRLASELKEELRQHVRLPRVG